MVDFWSENDIILQPVFAIIPCSVTLKVLLAAENNRAESHSWAPTRLPAFGKTPHLTLRARKRLRGQNVTNMHGDWVVNCQQSHATCLCRLITNCCHTFWLPCDRIFTSRISFEKRILWRLFCWRHLPSCRPWHAVYSHVLHHLRIWTRCAGFQIISQRISFSRSLVPTAMHPSGSHFKRFD